MRSDFYNSNFVLIIFFVLSAFDISITSHHCDLFFLTTISKIFLANFSFTSHFGKHTELFTRYGLSKKIFIYNIYNVMYIHCIYEIILTVFLFLAVASGLVQGLHDKHRCSWHDFNLRFTILDDELTCNHEPFVFKSLLGKIYRNFLCRKTKRTHLL